MNDKIFFFFYNFAHRSEFFDWWVFFTAEILPYIFIVFAFLFLLLHKEVLSTKNPLILLKTKWREILLVFFSGIFAWFLAHSLKIFFQEPRPFVKFREVVSVFSETGYAFPSGHATFFMALAIAIFLNHKKAGILFIISAILIGLARIVAGVHFPVDIFGGFVLGIFIAYFVRFVYDKVYKN